MIILFRFIILNSQCTSILKNERFSTLRGLKIKVKTLSLIFIADGVSLKSNLLLEVIQEFLIAIMHAY